MERIPLRVSDSFGYLTLLKYRLRYVLQRIGDIGTTAATLTVPLALRPDLLHEIGKLRESYERVSDSETHLKDVGYACRVRTFITEAAIVAHQALADEAEMARLEYECRNGRSISHVTGPIQSRLGQARSRMGAWKGEAEAYTRELDSQLGTLP